MKKTSLSLLLALAALVQFIASEADAATSQALYIKGYRIGEGEIRDNDGRIVVTNLAGEVKTDYIYVSDSLDALKSAFFNAFIPCGQQVIRWLAYNISPPTHTNQFAEAVTGYVWNLNKNDTASRGIVVDFDYITYTLKYNGSGAAGSMPSESHVYTNSFKLAANQFARTGYSFESWTNAVGAVFADKASVSGESFGVTYTNTATRTATLYAKWTPNSYTVTLDPCDGSVDPESVDVTYDAAWPTLPTPTRDGYYFDGWYNDDRYNTATPTNSTVAITGDAKIYAKWTRRLTATFIDPVDSNTQLVYVAYGSTPTAPFTPNHSGYKFSDWSPKLGSITQDTVYTAQFTGTQYFITYHSNFGIPEETRKIDYVYGTAKAALNGATEFPRAGYTFAGWATSADSDQIRFHAGEDIVTFSTEGDALYAVWEPIEYSISFDANGGEGKMDDASVEYGETYTVTNCTFTKAGVEFTGWTTNLAVSAEFKPGDAVSNLTATAGATVTFYAVWSEPRYIAFDGNGADNPDAMDIVAFDGIETNALPQCEFMKTGYTFDGWATNAVAATNLVVAYEDKANVISTNLWMAIGETNTFFAVWQTNLYTVVFNANGGMGEMEDQTFCYDHGQTLSKNTFTSSLMFMGWATNETGDVVFGDEVSVSNLTAEAGGVVNLYAVWDNGDLSKAMHCDNLYWKFDDRKSDESDNYSQWIPVVGPNEGYNPSGSVVSNEIGSALGTSASYELKPLSALQTAGLLSFRYKMSNAERTNQLVVQIASDVTNLAASTEWQQFGPVSIASNAEVQISYSCSTAGLGAKRHSVWIDQMTWVPGGAEPTDADRPTINGFTAKDGGFTLSVDGGNISDLFSYQILATNELVKGDWPVKTNLTADAIKEGFDIVPEAGEPKMFYKVKVVPKR